MKKELKALIIDCDNEIGRIKVIIDGEPFGLTTPYLTKYALIKACGTTERVFKSTIANYFNRSKLPQVQKFINKNVRESSCNPTYDRVVNMLAEYDEMWKQNFKVSIKNHSDYKKVIQSLDSLVSARNSFAHGGNPTITIGNIVTYFKDTIDFLYILDRTVK